MAALLGLYFFFLFEPKSDLIVQNSCMVLNPAVMEHKNRQGSSRTPTPKWIRELIEPDSVSYCEADILCPIDNLEQFAKDGMQYVNIEVHPRTVQQRMLQDLPLYADSAGFHLITTTNVEENILRWTRTVPRKLTVEDGKMGLTESRHNILRAIYITTAEEVADILAHDKQGLRIILDSVLEKLGGGNLTLVVMGIEQFRAMTEELEMAIIGLLVGLGVDFEHFETTDELYACIIEISKAMAEMPSKLAKRKVDEMADFYMRGDKKDCIIVDTEGQGLSRLWQQMLSVVPQSSLEMSRAITAEFPSPRALAQAMRSPEGVAGVADVGVARSNVPEARSRRAGPEMANTLRMLITEPDGNKVIEKNSETLS